MNREGRARVLDRQRRRLLRAALAALASGGCSARPGAGVAAAPAPDTRLPGEYILTLRRHADPEAVRAAFREHEVVDLRPVTGPHYLLRLRRDPGLDAIRSIAPPEVLAVQPSYAYRPQ